MFFRIFFFCFLLANVFGEEPIVLFVGTRPEAIKVIPIYEKLKERNIPAVLCSTGQHAELLQSVLDLFNCQPTYDFQIMKPGQDLSYVTAEVIKKSQELFRKINPSLVIVQGDTASAVSAALAAFFEKIPVAHIEAGLRSNNLNSPFPEEMNRRILTLLSDYHFAPTAEAVLNLLNEDIEKASIFLTGNTIVDSLLHIQNKIDRGEILPSNTITDILDKSMGQKSLLLTAHRRESFGHGLKQIFSAIKEALDHYPHLHVIYPTHPNPAISQMLLEMEMHNLPNLTLLPPLPYQDLVYLLNRVDAIATDSGGIQEEGVSLNKLVFVLRNETDRPEGITKGTAYLVGTDKQNILDHITQFMDGSLDIKASGSSIFGDGTAADQIVDSIEKILLEKNSHSAEIP
jgi:UDP-N-acetylglucosamine 2-epimerase (non-hydrolysing)